MQDVLLPLGPAFPATDAMDASSPTISSLAGGGYVIARVGGADSVWVQRFDADGAEVGAEILVSSGSLEPPTNLTVAGLSDGSFVVSWSKTASAGAFPDNYARIFGPDGSPAGAEFVTLAADPNGRELFALANGGFVLTRSDFGAALLAQRFDETGSAVGGEITVETGGPGNTPVSAQGVGLAGGGFVVIWSALASGIVAINGQLVDDAGQLVGGTFEIAPLPGWKGAIAALPSGGFVVSWTDSAMQVKAQIFDGAAQPVGGPITVTEPGHTGLAWSVTALPDDAFVIGWRDNFGGSAVTQNVQMFDSEGHQVGSDLVFTSSFNIGDGDIQLVSPGGGRIVALPGLQQLISAPALGTSGDDVFLGTPDDDRYMGLAGNDLIRGAAANDELDGGDGVDVIAGEGGDDTLYGGSGADELSGGAGHDTFHVDDAADLVNEAVGAGTDRVIAEASYALAGGMEIEALEAVNGSAAIDLTGNEFGNSLIGNAGANALHGLAGNDVLLPGAGIDLVRGGAGDDTIVIADLVQAGEVLDGGADFDTLALRPAAGLPPGAFSSHSLANAAAFEVERLRFDSSTNALMIANLTLGQVTNQPSGGQLTHVEGGAGTDLLYLSTAGSAGTAFMVPSLTFGNWASSESPDLLAGDVVALLASGTGDYTLIARDGLASTQYLVGGSGNDTLTGSSGADRLNGLGGVNVLQGHGGNDTLIVSNTGDPATTYSGAGSTFDGGSGTDVLHFSGPVDFQGTVSNIEGIYLAPASPFILPHGTNVTIQAATLAALGPALTLSGTGTIEVVLAPGDTFDASGYVHAPGSSVSLLVTAPATGESGDQGINFGAAFTAANIVDLGDGTNDQIGLEGNYTGDQMLVLGAGTVAGVEVIAVLPGFSYDVTTVDANVPGGGLLTIFAGNLGPGDVFSFDGSAESDGSLKVFGGGGTDLVTTGAGDDTILFGPDRFDPLGDRIDGGAGAGDQLVLDGHYTLTLDGIAIRNVETVALLPGIAGDLADYDLALADSLIGAGQTMAFRATGLQTALTIDGAAEADGSIEIHGGLLGDTLTGGGGSDRLDGGAGADVLAGLGGADSFAFTTALGPGNVDTLADFAGGSDTVLLDDALFTGLAAGTLAAGAFVAGTAAADADDRIVFDAGTGALWFDADGNGAGAAVLFATLAPGLGIAASDFLVI